jgi:hypothetical protein
MRKTDHEDTCNLPQFPVNQNVCLERYNHITLDLGYARNNSTTRLPVDWIIGVQFPAKSLLSFFSTARTVTDNHPAFHLLSSEGLPRGYRLTTHAYLVQNISNKWSYISTPLIPVAELSKARVTGRQHAGIAGSNPSGRMDASFL